jgi:hypothetical protein
MILDVYCVLRGWFGRSRSYCWMNGDTISSMHSSGQNAAYSGRWHSANMQWVEYKIHISDCRRLTNTFDQTRRRTFETKEHNSVRHRRWFLLCSRMYVSLHSVHDGLSTCELCHVHVPRDSWTLVRRFDWLARRWAPSVCAHMSDLSQHDRRWKSESKVDAIRPVSAYPMKTILCIDRIVFLESYSTKYLLIEQWSFSNSVYCFLALHNNKHRICISCPFVFLSYW